VIREESWRTIVAIGFFKEDNYQRKYNYEQMVIMLGKIERGFKNKLKTKKFGVEA
jgi:hypothetical protein